MGKKEEAPKLVVVLAKTLTTNTLFRVGAKCYPRPGGGLDAKEKVVKEIVETQSGIVVRFEDGSECSFVGPAYIEYETVEALEAKAKAEKEVSKPAPAQPMHHEPDEEPETAESGESLV